VRDYELTVVFSPEIAGEDIDAAIEGVSQLITQKEGVIKEVNRWGKRRLAYQIENFREGNYVLIQLKLQPSQVAELDAKLKSREGVLRHLLVRLEE
jgi:small subunit ribosomal protein S6